jgi:methyl coenzyme M reductase gamma subunit
MDFAQIVRVRDAIDKGNDKVETRLQYRVEATEPFDDQRMLLRHDAYRLDDDDYRNDEQG